MTVWISLDGAGSWPLSRLIYGGPSAYSSLAADEAGFVYLLFEMGQEQRYEKIALARFNMEWLFKRNDWRAILEHGYGKRDEQK